MKHVLLWAEDSESDLGSELRSVLPAAHTTRLPAALLEAGFEASLQEPLPQLAFARQFLPDVIPVSAQSIREWAALLLERAAARLPEDQPWLMHVEPHYGETATHRIGARAWHTLRKTSSGQPARPSPDAVDPHAGRRRCELIREAVLDLLRKTRRGLLKRLGNDPVAFTPDHSLVQLLLTSPEAGFLSVCVRPVPFIQRHLVSPFPLGRVVAPPDTAAPSRAFAKLVEAETRLGCAIRAGQTCVDLGAAPGSWTYVAQARGARVIAVDRSPLRQDLMKSRAVRFVSHDAFTFRPETQVDWLLCDVIAEPGRSAALLLEWLRRGWCRRFVVTLKLKGGPSLDILEQLRSELPNFSADWHIKKLCANKKEACIFGVSRN